MTKRIFYMLLLCATVVFASCNKRNSTLSAAFNNLTADGSATATTATLTLTFDKTIEGLSADDITLTPGETGTTKGALTDKSNGVYELAVSGITKGGEITVAVAKTGYAITPASKTVTVNYVAAAVEVAFNNLTADGSSTATTTTLTLTFDKAIEGLSADDITLTPGETGTTKGALTDKSNGVYELAVSGVTKGGEITLAVAKTGYAITPASKTVTVNIAAVAIGNFYYDDNTFSSTIDANKTCIGIVFWVDPNDNTKGKILRLKGSAGFPKWGAWGVVETSEGINSTTDGATATKNLITARKDDANFATDYAAFEWVYRIANGRDVNGRWYIPAKEELLTLYGSAYNGDQASDESVKVAVNASLTIARGDTIWDWYWSSTQSNDEVVWGVDFSSGGGAANGKATVSSKKSTRTVRVVSAFQLIP